jgi:hypothetical protein
MAGRKTIDGIKLSTIVKTMKGVKGIEIRPGTKHRLVAEAPEMRSCPIATSTHARRMLAPWFAQYIGCSATEAYSHLKSGQSPIYH